MIRLEAKRPTETRDYSHDWSAFLGDDTIASQTTTSSEVTVDSSAIGDDAQSVRFALSGGEAGTARITQTIVTAGGNSEIEVFTLAIAGADEPVSLADVKAQCRIETANSDEDALLANYITAARQHIETLTGQVLVRRTFTDAFERFGP